MPALVVQEELVERVSWLLAEEEQQMVEQQQQQPLEGEELPESPSSVLDTITATEINKMKVGGGAGRELTWCAAW